MEGRIMLSLKMEKQSLIKVKYLIQAKAKCECESIIENVVCLSPLRDNVSVSTYSVTRWMQIVSEILGSEDK